MSTAVQYDLADRLEQAWRSGVAIEPPSETDGLSALADAYAVQQRWTERRVAAGERVIGRKIGLTSAAVQRQMGVDSPDFGTLWASRWFPAPAGRATVDARRFLQPRIEGELAFLIGPEPPQTAPVTLEAVLAATAAVAPAIEIVDSRIADWRIALPDTVADNASFGGFVVGEWDEQLVLTDLSQVSMSLRDGEAEVSSGIGADALGHPAAAVAWLATTLLGFGTGLAPGDIVLSGAMGPLVPVTPSHTYTLAISDQPPLAVSFTTEGENDDDTDDTDTRHRH